MSQNNTESYDQSALTIYANKMIRDISTPTSINRQKKQKKKSNINNIIDPVVLLFNKSFAERLLKLQYIAMKHQYDLAYLNTMGGAYFLCSRPKYALEVARKQEQLACQLGSVSLLYRARGFQAVNLGLLGNRHEAECYLKKLAIEASTNGYNEMAKVLEAMLVWMQLNHDTNNGNNVTLESGTMCSEQSLNVIESTARLMLTDDMSVNHNENSDFVGSHS